MLGPTAAAAAESEQAADTLTHSQQLGGLFSIGEFCCCCGGGGGGSALDSDSAVTGREEAAALLYDQREREKERER